MSVNIAAVHFNDGLIMYTTYQDTADVLNGILYDNYITSDLAYSETRDKCTCGQDEPAEAATWGLSWDIKACRYCKVVSEGQSPYGLEGWGGAVLIPAVKTRDEPEWWKILVSELRGENL